MATAKKRILWAVDSYAKDKAFQFKVAKTLVKLAKEHSAEIEPVCVLSPDQLRLPRKLFLGGAKEYRLQSEETLQKWVKTLKSPAVLAPRLLVQEDFSVKSSVKALVEYAKSSGAELIGVGTHSRKSLHRFFIGSFAESLLHASDVPVLVISPKVSPTFKPQRILFPTDFSDKSLKALQRLFPLASGLGSKVVLYHKVQFEVPPALYGFDPTALYQDFLLEDLATKRVTAERWVTLAAQSGVKVETAIDPKPGYAVEAILGAVKKQKCDWIAMASESGALAATVLGSISRQVVRHSSVPVWVIHPVTPKP
jgi:nucleotide-binding universal stress UspA family protein